MFVLQKLISRLLFPVPLILALLIGGLLLRDRAATRRARRMGAMVSGAGCLILWLACTAPLADAFLWTLEGRYPPLSSLADLSADSPPDPVVVAVLGAGFSEREGFGPWASLGDTSRARVIEALRLVHGSVAPIMVFSGYGAAGRRSSAEVNRDAAVELGLNPERTVVLDTPRNTAEEAAAVARQFPAATVVLVTSASHMPRAVSLFNRVGLSVVPAPADYLSASRHYTIWSLIPSAEALRRTERAWYEYLGLLLARFS